MNRSERGFTLIEMLTSITVMGIVFAGVGGGVLIALRTTDKTRDRVAQSTDGQLTSAYFVTDIQSAENVSIIAADVYNCGGTPTPANAPLPLIRFKWTDPGAPQSTTSTTSAGISNEASYVVETINGERRLERRLCSGSNPVFVQPMARSLRVLPSPSASVSCTPACTGRPQGVSLTIYELTSASYTINGTGRVKP